MDFVRNWQPDLILTWIFIIGGLAQIIIPQILAKEKLVWRSRIGGIVFIILGLAFLAIRFI
jgi:cytochrome c biogenesis protein CcdA